MQKTDVRIVAATNINISEAISKEKFREDLYYRLSTVEIGLPPLRERKEDIVLLFRKFASDFAQKYHMPPIKLDEQSQELLMNYRWSGNIRQLRNVAEQISVLEKEREINASCLSTYLPNRTSQLPALVDKKNSKSDFGSEREILYKVLFDMKSDLNDLKKLTHDLIKNGSQSEINEKNQSLIEKIYGKETVSEKNTLDSVPIDNDSPKMNKLEPLDKYSYAETIEEEEPLSLHEKELEMIKQALIRSKGKRKLAAQELGISERTLYRKIKQFDLNEQEKI